MSTYLSEGVFLALLCTIKKAGPRPSNLKRGGTDNITEPDIPTELIGIYNPNFFTDERYGSLKSLLPKYKTGEKSISTNAASGFADKDMREDFDHAIKSRYGEKLKSMETFVNNYLDCFREKPVQRVVMALLFIIKNDDTIPATDAFYITPDGRPVDKATLLQQTEFNFPALLLGVWHYIIMFHQENQNGANTFSQFFKRTIKGAQYKLNADFLEKTFPEPIKLLFGTPTASDEKATLDQEHVVLQQGKAPEIIDSKSNADEAPATTILTQSDLPKYSDYYNLIVGFPPLEIMANHPNFDIPDNPPTTPGEAFWVQVEKARFLTYTIPELREKFSQSNQLADFPTLYLFENHAYGKAEPEQKVAYCKIQQIIPQETGMLAHLKVLLAFPQDVLNQNLQLLGIKGKWSHDFHELNHTHWAVKKINLSVIFHIIGIELPCQS